MDAPITLEIVQGGPLAGLPAFFIRFTKKQSAIPLAGFISVMNEYTPPPVALYIVFGFAPDFDEERLKVLAKVLSMATNTGMQTIVETYETWHPWMMAFNYRVLHTEHNTSVSFPAEEIHYYTEMPPENRLYPFHIAKPPTIWWHPSAEVTDIVELPQNIRVSAKTHITLFPKEKP